MLDSLIAIYEIVLLEESSVAAIFEAGKVELLINIIICVSVGLVFYYVEKPVAKFVAQKLNLSV